jgi:dihydrofolate reductase
MRRLVVGTFVSLDGVMQAPGGPNEDREGGFPHGGWLVPYYDEKLVEIMTEWTVRAGAFLLGRKTYEIFAGSWPKSTDPADEIATALNTRPKYVASRTLDKVDWNNSTLLKGTLPEVAKLKARRWRDSSPRQRRPIRPYSSTISSIRYVSGSFPLFSVPASVCSGKARSRAASVLSTLS